MRSYAQYCPIAKASEILGDRWTPLDRARDARGRQRLQLVDRSACRGSGSASAPPYRLRSLERAEIVARRTGPKGRTLGSTS